MTSLIRPRARLAATFFPLLTTLAVSAGAARAQNMAPHATSIDPQLFQPAIGPQNFLTVEGAQVPDHKRLSFGLELNYQQRPYSAFTVGGPNAGTTYIVDNQLTGELDAAIGLFNRYQLGIGIPFTPYLDGYVVNDMGMPANLHLKESGIGDVRIEGKAHLATLGPDDQYDLAISAGFTLPTGHTGDRDWLGDKSFTGRIRAIGTVDLGPVTVAGNLGILIRGTSHTFATELGPQLLYGAAASYAVDAKTGVILEAAGRSGLNQFVSFYSDVNPFEIDLAGRRSINGMWSLTGGVGRGVGSGIGAPDFRGFLMAAFNPDFRDRDHDGVYDVSDRCPDQPEDRDGFQDADGCPDPDNDADGIPDASDKCPNEAEDVDDYQDQDGCPDPDNDKDGIPDLNDACPNAAEDHKGKRPNDGCPSTSEDSDGDGVPDVTDKCPDEPEDKDGFEDADGCPDPDNDADGIPDNFDNCPNAPEDADGFQDEDGCPDPDNDKDGIPDASDKCPTQPETLNGIKDDDGCPDPGPEVVRLGQGRIEVDEKIGFGTRGGKLLVREASAKWVNDVALVLKGHTEITKLRIDVKAEGVPKSEAQRRADALREYLIAKGIDAGRLEAVGEGAGGSHIDFIVEATAPEPGTPGAPAAGSPPRAPRGAVDAAQPDPEALAPPGHVGAAADPSGGAGAFARAASSERRAGARHALMRITGWGASDVGRKRTHNEDSFLCNDELRLYAVADGMGGHLGGERASRMAVDILEHEIADMQKAGLLKRPEHLTSGAAHPLNALLRRAVIEADRNIYETAMANPELAGMGTTLTALMFSDGYVHLGHVGDSRAYLYRDGRARQLTEDHSWIQEQVRAGLISPEEAKESRFRNIITRSVGFEPSVEPDLAGIAVQAGDCFVICSDGLSNYLTIDELAQVLTGHFYRDVAKVFVDLANERGGDDNVTCLVIYAGNEA